MIDLLKRSWLAVLAGALLLGIGAYWLMDSTDLEQSSAEVTAANAHTAAAGGARPASGAGAAAPWAVTVSDAMGLTLDASRLFQLGFAGGLVIDADTRASIEAVINSMPDPPSADDLARLERTLREGLPREDAEKALKLMTDYRHYTEDVRNEMQPKGIPNSMEEARAFFDQMDAVKRRHFDDATANALFGQADNHARLTMEAMFVQQDTGLSPEQKKARLDALRAQLPADQKSLIPAAEPAASQPAS